MKASRGSAVIVLAAVLLLLIIAGAYASNTSPTGFSKVPAIGAIKSVGVAFYTDPKATQNLTSLDWGTISPGSVNSKQAYMKNTGNTPCHASMITSNWKPTDAINYLNCTWSYNGILQPNQTVPVTFTLTVSPAAEALTSFSFDIQVTATE